MSLTLYGHPFAAYCWKALIALYENDTPFEFHLVDLGDEAARNAYYALWPIGKMPLLRDGEVLVPEATIVIEHLAIHHPGPVALVPADPDAALQVRLRDRIFDNYVADPMQRIVADRLRPVESRDPTGVAEHRARLRSLYPLIDGWMAGQTWAAGEDFTMADCAACPALHYADVVEPIGPDHPHAAAYLARLKARPSFARVLKEAEPYLHFFPQE